MLMPFKLMFASQDDFEEESWHSEELAEYKSK